MSDCISDHVTKTLFLIGSMLFLGGSILFHPGLNCTHFTCVFWGAFCFIVGSTSAFLGGAILMVNSCKSRKVENIVTIYSDAVASALFIAGSVFFLPSITKIDGVIEGVLFFTVGCVILVFNSLMNVHTAFSCHAVAKQDFLFILTRELCIIVGSLLFIVGSIMFIPLFFHEYVVNFFIIGSLFFIFHHFMCYFPPSVDALVVNHSYVSVHRDSDKESPTVAQNS